MFNHKPKETTTKQKSTSDEKSISMLGLVVHDHSTTYSLGKQCLPMVEQSRHPLQELMGNTLAMNAPYRKPISTVFGTTQVALDMAVNTTNMLNIDNVHIENFLATCLGDIQLLHAQNMVFTQPLQFGMTHMEYKWWEMAET
jgi:hypothetical protein